MKKLNKDEEIKRMTNIKQELNDLVSILKRRTGYIDGTEPDNRIIIGVNLQAQNGSYFVTVHCSDSEITKLFEKNEIIQAIADFLKCEEYIGHPIDEFKADYVCEGSIRR